VTGGVGPYHVEPLSAGRRAWVRTLDLTWPKHPVYGLLEVDVTLARRLIGVHAARTGETLSFTGFLTACLAKAVDEDRSIQAYLKGRRQKVLFDDVNVGMMIERKVGAGRALMGHVLRAANHKSYRAIHDEIRAVQAAPIPPGHGMPRWFRIGTLLPWPLSRLFMAAMRWMGRRDPRIGVAMGGTVAVTSVGMFGGGHHGWALTPTPSTLALVVGGIAWKPVVVDGRIEPRELLDLSLMFDHDVVDGGPAARFTRRLVELIEAAHGLRDLVPDPPAAASEPPLREPEKPRARPRASPA
jgi:pyruvate/2-oxoglutarate dehydrogenase complex dihydrolipoamide acyltransferase (E2) component